MVKDMNDIKETLKSIQQTLDQAHGGWRMLIAVGSASALVGGFVAWLFQHFGK